MWDRAEEVRHRFLADIRKRRNPQTDGHGQPAARPLPRPAHRRPAHGRGLPGVRRQARPPVHRHVEGRRDRRRDPGLALRRDAAVPGALPRPSRSRPPHDPPSRVRCPVSTAPVPAARGRDDPQDSLHPERRLQARGALAVGGLEPDGPGRATAGAGTRPAAADTRGSGAARRRGVAPRPRLGDVRLADDGHRRSPRRGLRAALAVRRPRARRDHDPARGARAATAATAAVCAVSAHPISIPASTNAAPRITTWAGENANTR